jgi:hypothetical protein
MRVSNAWRALAGKARFMHRLGGRFAFFELSKPVGRPPTQLGETE